MAMLAVSCAEEGSASKVKQDLYKGLDTLRTERSRTKACAAAPHTMHTKLQDAGHLHGLMPATSESRFKHSSLESGVRRRGLTRRHLSLPGMFGVSCLHPVISLRRADGPINTIVQSGNILAAASSLATARNPPIEVVEQEACGFTLQLLLRDEIYASRDHKERMMRHDQLGAVGKPYSVESIAIDPNKPGRVVTAGNDGFVTVRDIDDVIGASSIFRSSPPEAPGQYPRGLQFRSSDSALAIPHSDGSIHIYKLDGSRADEIEHRMQAKLSIIGGDLHPVVRMVWGPSDMLYAVYEGGNAGHCVAFDIQRPNLPCKFQDIHETGEAVTINPSGQSIVVFTRDQDAIHKLRIYDVARRNVKHSLSLDLLPFATTQNDRCMDKITAASYSPDERLIAVGRSDDQLHLYDRRNMGKGPILQFKHRENPACRAAQSNGGIARLEWIQAWDGRGLGLVSGGGDGCVRVWDALGSSNDPLNGHTIAQLDSAVSDFSLGEQFKDEKPLAVGTESGGVYVYDRKR
ncbi:WD40-repeat-containing domain protein [Amylostereum chailletii]|nr:WD40-repeat-containing domain protein [Amylostereum chailletii]